MTPGLGATQGPVNNFKRRSNVTTSGQNAGQDRRQGAIRACDEAVGLVRVPHGGWLNHRRRARLPDVLECAIPTTPALAHVPAMGWKLTGPGVADASDQAGLSHESVWSFGLKTLAALAGFLILGLSPSFVDWKQSPELHGEVILYYAVALALIYFGVLA